MLYGQTNALLESCKVSVDKKMLIMKWFQLSLCKHQLVSGVVKSLYQCTMTFPMEIDIFKTRPKPAYSRKGLDWIVRQEYSYRVLIKKTLRHQHRVPTDLHD